MTSTPTHTPTPGQTVGPFFHYALPYAGDRDLVAPGTGGAVFLHGTVRDGDGAPLQDALVEIWQADPHGRVPRRQGSLRRDGHTFTGFGRASTDRTGRYTFTTLAPGSVDGGLPFFAVTVFARGLLDRLFTRAYLPLEPGATDAVLTAAGERAETLVCVADDDGLRFDIRLQDHDGDAETVFLTYPGHPAR
ncbi:protocatechuate 3,4-dioxygenase subunit alpha [Pseudonocardia phyllosphaerae]|uniref:protocatechuate 3,4-dioxygenase subunit alpha n=1 Tax=Pseudonocardia phyllosphaerae TaxID=3390502 RepID=UPI00397DE642